MLGLGVARAFWYVLVDWYPPIFFSSSTSFRLPLAAVDDFIGVFKGGGAFCAVVFVRGGGLGLRLDDRRDEWVGEGDLSLSDRLLESSLCDGVLCWPFVFILFVILDLAFGSFGFFKLSFEGYAFVVF